MGNARWAGSQRRATLPRGWSAIRRRVLARDPVCALCRARPSTDCDHIGDPHDHRLVNLRGLCGPCHTTRSSAQGGQVSGTRRAARAHAARTRPSEPHPGRIQ